MYTSILPAASVCLSVSACIFSTSGCGASVDATQAAQDDSVAVQSVIPQRVTWQRNTVQPATVHAYYEAQVFAKASGYLAELHVDIGQQVKQGELLAVIDIPEMRAQREAKLATIAHLQADEKRAIAQLTVAGANTESYGAKVEKAKAEVGGTQAVLNATRSELQRMRDLVTQKAVAGRLLDESTQQHEASQAQSLTAQAAVASATAELMLAHAQVKTAEADFQVAQALTEVARRELDELDAWLEYAQLKSPFDGVVTQRNVDPGDLVRNAQAGSGGAARPLLVVTRLDKVRVRVSVPERDAPLVSNGDEASIVLPALPGQVFSGSVARAAGVLDEKTRTMLIEIDLANPDGQILPGMFGQATISLEPARERITLPAGCVRYDEEGNSTVYTINASSQIEVVPVQTGLDDGRQIEIVGGLIGSQRVVGPLLQRLKAGQMVRVD